MFTCIYMGMSQNRGAQECPKPSFFSMQKQSFGALLFWDIPIPVYVLQSVHTCITIGIYICACMCVCVWVWYSTCVLSFCLWKVMAAARGEKRPTLDAEDGNHAKKPRGKKGKGKGTGKAKGKSTPNQNTGASGANGSEAVDPDTAPGVGAPEVGPDGDVGKDTFRDTCRTGWFWPCEEDPWKSWSWSAASWMGQEGLSFRLGNPLHTTSGYVDIMNCRLCLSRP